jgi:pilus assembly protein CpaB
MRVFIVLALAIAAGGTFAFGTYRYMQNVPAQTVSVPTSGVVVAAADLQLGTELRQETARHPVAITAISGVRSPSQRNWLAVASFSPLPQRTVPAQQARTEGSRRRLPPVIAPGYRALSVRVNDVIGVAGYVLPGNRVDVVATVNPTQQPTDVTSKVVLTNVLVLASGTKIERDAKDNKPISVNVVTMLVNPEEAERLTLASTEGKIQLALRSPWIKPRRRRRAFVPPP